ncbi:MAG: hypothetical protein EHM45_23650 [Desulfobacteraceae bacterium]|nr:MAG: hypothetical protein EHM45_23650 [Desulfobacteraceae bacterium]
MDAVRFLESPRNGRITIDLPGELKKKKKLEIIILPYEDHVKKPKAFDPAVFRGAGNLNMTVEEIEHECRRLRDEWDRGF